MYINKIDDLIDKIIDDFYITVISTNKNLTKIIKESNFSKYQKEINETLDKYIKVINIKEIQDIVKSGDAVTTIKETIKKYTTIYLFLTIGFHYSNKDDTYINNIIEFTKYQSSYEYKIVNFFNSEGNALIIKYYFLIKNIVALLNADKNKLEIMKSKQNYKDAIVFLNSLGGGFVNKNFKLESVDNNINDQCHNIIKTIIIVELYKTYEKKDFFRMLEITESLEGEYTFIDIVVPTKRHIDFSTIESLLTRREINEGMANSIWDYLMEYEDKMNEPPETNENKILMLLKGGFMHPICDDFLLYHKDSENYDRKVDDKMRKKDDTKIRYIVNKIESTTDYYNEAIKRDKKLLDEIKKNFYGPLTNKKAILINHLEDIKIINKYLNYDLGSGENSGYVEDLKKIKLYPYINFKDFEHGGFSLTLENTINIVRAINFTANEEAKQNSFLQMRVGSKNMTVNIVGFMIPTNLKSIYCLKHKHVVDIRKIVTINKNKSDKSNNKLIKNKDDKLVTTYLESILYGGRAHKASLYWLFDDTMQVGQEGIKTIIANIYDNVINGLTYYIIEKIENEKKITIQEGYRIIKEFTQNIINIPKSTPNYNEIETAIYSSLEKVAEEYDKNEDIMFGLLDDVVSMKKHNIKDKVGIKTIVLNTATSGKHKNKSNDDDDNGDISNSVCQHTVTWNRLMTMHKSRNSKYTDEMNIFTQQYVLENVDGEYVCKSCGAQINIKKYITDGVFDNDTQKFITYGTPMEIPLEDMIEYEKYKVAIRNLDKYVEKVAMVANILNYIGTNTNVRSKRNIIVKDAIDIMLLNNQKKIFEERNKYKNAKYGIGKDLTKMFAFPLENSIFIHSSKDVDYFKLIKQNNILAYLIIMIMIEINDTQLTFIGTDKKGTCNFSIFDNIYEQLFANLKIIKNNAGDTVPITDYKILCYIMYIISCSIVKYNMWHFEYPDKANKKQFVSLLQKSVIHTVVDILNSILEYATNKNANHIYEIISVKFYKKMSDMFSNEEIYANFKLNAELALYNNKKVSSVQNKEQILLSGKYTPMPYEEPIRKTQRPPKYYIKQREKLIYQRIFYKNNITNCNDGKFHSWKYINKSIRCAICDVKMIDIKMDDKFEKNDAILKNFKYDRLQNYALKYCIKDGELHHYVKNVCTKCKNSNAHKYSHSELDKINDILEEHRKSSNAIENKKNKQNQKNIDEEQSYYGKVTEHIIKTYGSTSDYGYIKNLLDEIQNVIGNEAHIGSDTFLIENSYIIDHDHLGYPLNKPVIITDGDNKIMHKTNHPFFKTDVIYFSSYKNGKIDVFYDAITKILLGYKEESKNYSINNLTDKKITIKYSIFNKLKLMGYNYQYINVTEAYNDYVAEMGYDENDKNINSELITKLILNDLIKMRTHNLKKAITEFQRLIYRIFNSWIGEDAIVDKHSKKIQHIHMSDANNKHTVFKHWKGVVNGFVPHKISAEHMNINFGTYKMINAEIINNMDKTGNMILYFITIELHKLFKYNTTKFVKANISYFIIDYINTTFALFNQENMMDNFDVKRFKYIMNSDMKKNVNDNFEKASEEIYSENIQNDEQNIIVVSDSKDDDGLPEESESYDMEIEEDSDALSDGER